MAQNELHDKLILKNLSSEPLPPKEFDELHDVLNKRLDRLEILAFLFDSYANALSPRPERMGHLSADPAKSYDGVLGQLWAKSNKLQEIINRLEDTNTHFTELI